MVKYALGVLAILSMPAAGAAADVARGAPLGVPVASGPGAAEVNCASSVPLRTANARIYRADLIEEERGVVFAWAQGNVTFSCFTDRDGSVVRVMKKSGDDGYWKTAR